MSSQAGTIQGEKSRVFTVRSRAEEPLPELAATVSRKPRK